MAEVFLGMQEGIGGFEKLVVIKRIFPQFCEDENFVRMFLDEARLAASIHHQNVVQIQDIEQDDQGFFIVMEYLSGESCAYLFEALRARGECIPPHIVCRIIAEIAAGLHQAHTATDAGGEPQPIVHRDVTPSNLIVSFNGVVKVVDFGVAKATLSEGYTQAGALKGKMSYLAPEQVEDLPVDGRTDIFQLGICMHELLTGQRLFTGENDHQKMLAVMEKQIPVPSSIVPGIPQELDRVVLWTLERNPDRRPQSADILRRELEKVLRDTDQVASDHDVGEWMKTALAKRYRARQEMERECVSEMREGRASTAPPVSIARPPTGSGLPITQSGPRPVSGTRAGTPTLATVLHRKTASATIGSLSARQGWVVAGILSLCMTVVVVGLWMLPKNDPKASAAKATNSALGAVPGAGAAENTQPANEPAAGETGKPGEVGEQAAADATEESSVQQVIGTVPDPAENDGGGEVEGAETFHVSLSVIPADAHISVDGVDRGRGELEADFDAAVSHRLRVTREGYRAEEKSFGAGAGLPARIELQPVEAERTERTSSRTQRKKRSSRDRSARKSLRRKRAKESRTSSRERAEAPAPRSELRDRPAPPVKPVESKPRKRRRKRPKTDSKDPWK